MIETSVIGSLAVLTLVGEFDLTNSDDIRSVTAELVSGHVTDITIDFSQVTFLDAATIGALVGAQRLVGGVDGRLLLIGLSGATARVFTLARADRTLPVLLIPGGDGVPALPSVDEESVSRGHDGDLTGQFYGLSRVLLAEQTLTGDLRRIVQAAVEAVPGCDAASAALIAVGKARTGVCSSEVAIEVDVAQYRSGEGPCLEAGRLGHRVRVDVVEPGEPYRHFAPWAVDAGVNAILSAPVIFAGETVGSLNLYSDSTDAFDRTAETMADVLAAQAATAIHRSSLYATVRRLTTAAQQHSDSRSQIAVAEGAMAVLQHCSIEQAQQLLRSAADTNREDLADAARRIIGQLA